MQGRPEPSSALDTCWFCDNEWGQCTCAFPKDDGSGEELPGFDANGRWISSPNVSECSRFFVDPIETYGTAFVEWVKQEPALLARLSADKQRAIATYPHPTTTVDIVIRLRIAGTVADLAKHRAALAALADVMRVQAEDGLWTAGYEDGGDEEEPNAYIANIDNAGVLAIIIGDQGEP